jgi:hypothetical protein
MLRAVRSRLRLCIGVSGCAVLVTSFLSWALSLHAADGRFTWVKIDPSHAASAETAELWHVSASCVRPYFVRAALRSKAKLEAHYKAAPAEVRARLNAQAYPAQSVQPATWNPSESGRQNQTGRSSDPYGEYVAALQVKYAEWYAALFRFEIEAGKWQQRLLDVADQTVLLSAASRASFGAYAGGDIKLTGLPGDFDGSLLTALGLGGLSSDEQMSLKSACVTISPVMQSFHNPRVLGQLWRWPVDCLAEFSLGLELVLVSIFFAPIAAWLGIGNLQARSRIRMLTDRLGTGIRDFSTSKLVCGVLQRVRQIQIVGRGLLDRSRSYAAKRRTRDAVARIAKPERGSAGRQRLRSDQRQPRTIKAAIRHD